MSQMLNVLRKLILNDCNHGKNHLLKMNHSKFQKETKYVLFYSFIVVLYQESFIYYCSRQRSIIDKDPNM